MKKNVFIGLLLLVLLGACGSSPSSKAPDTTGVTSYYVRANGSDSNTGTSEDKPFKTLAKALQTASKTSIKKITVIGVLNGGMTINDAKKCTASPVKKIVKNIDIKDGEDIDKILENLIGVAQIEGSYDKPNPNEILITGKPNASAAEKAVLTHKGGYVLLILTIAVRLEHIEISGNENDGTILVAGGDLTLGQGAKVTKNLGGATIYAVNSTVIMRDNAEVSYNEGGNDAGVYLENGSVGIMLDNAIITNNKAVRNGGGVGLNGATFIMKNNAVISNNSAGNAGGGIITFTDKKEGYSSRIILENNASITKNSAKIGGGILLQNELEMRDTVQITENTAIEKGGGIYAELNFKVTKGKSTILANNHAPNFPDTNIRFND